MRTHNLVTFQKRLFVFFKTTDIHVNQVITEKELKMEAYNTMSDGDWIL